ncbi:universal stress protein [Rhodobaculum claviforme]|uniref:Universal stress protein UspA n=1 Tax=Rhodobaculum claviforme TaxID=1549854 RepID=A0A934THV9_9RHOB|nr:universal stress protein [Rhodobaculum claviforme]MBK5926182.1 universal stress protein UspA [Rhodobaculum claviforme]
MYRKILVPVDLGHLDVLQKALATAGDLAKHHGIPVIYVGVTGTVPDAVARTPQEFARKLHDLAAAEAERHGITATAHPLTSPDPSADLSRVLRRAVRELGADLVVMASHPPSPLDWLMPSQGGSVAEHSEASVFIVR